MTSPVLLTQVLDCGLLKKVLALLAAEADAGATAAAANGGAPPPATPTLRAAAWCLHNLAKHKREKDMVRGPR